MADGANLQWRVGQVTITRMLEIEQLIHFNPTTPFMADARPQALLDIPWLYPDFISADGALRLSIHALLVETSDLRLVVDTCVGNDRVRAHICEEPLQTSFIERMTEAGWSPETVDTVLCTHLHVDHVGWNMRRVDGAWSPTFPNARYLVGRKEFEHFRLHSIGEQQVVFADSIQPIVDAGLMDFIETDHRLSSEVRLVATPGHTPGHVSVMIESDGAQAMITGDAIHHPAQMAHPHWAPPWEFDGAMAEVTRRTLLDQVADQPVLVIGTHFAAPTAGAVKRDGAAYRFY